MVPIIGLIVRRESKDGFEQVIFHQEYMDVVLQFGGEPLIICYGSTWDKKEKNRISKWLKQCDGIVVTGGDKPTELDYYVVDYAIKHHVPLFGICLGMQVMGTYESDHKIVPVGTNEHNKKEKYVHEVVLDDTSRLYQYLGNYETILVNSRHIEKIESGGIFKIVGMSHDGIIEAIENTHHPFQIGVQWHPESMACYDENSKKLWKKFITVCKKSRR